MIPPKLLNTITTGDARELAKAIPDESVDLILTDPPYRNLGDYIWLAEAATRILKPDSALLVYCATGLLPETHDALRAGGGITYRWRFVTRFVYSVMFLGKLLCNTQECLWYEKGRSKPLQAIYDCDLSSTKGSYLVEGANWGKGIDMIGRYIQTFCPVNGVVLDPFGGSGTIAAVCKMLGRNYILFEIDPDTAERARQRVEQTQMPLPGLLYDQATLELCSTAPTEEGRE